MNGKSVSSYEQAGLVEGFKVHALGVYRRAQLFPPVYVRVQLKELVGAEVSQEVQQTEKELPKLVQIGGDKL